MRASRDSFRSRWPLLLASVLMLGLAGCEGDDGAQGPAGPPGADGQDAVNTGIIAVTVTFGGGPVEGATVTTDPATSSADTDANGEASLTVPIGVYDVTVTIAGISVTETGVNVAAGLTSPVALTVSGLPGVVTGKVLAPDGTPVEGATISAPGSVDVLTDANGDFAIDSVVRAYLSVTPPGGTTYLPGGTRESATPGDVVEIVLSGGPEAGADYLSSDVCMICHGGGLANAWMSSGHFRVVERSLVEMDTNGWPDDPGAGLCSAWFDTGVDANDPSEDPSSAPSHDAYIRTCNDDPDLRYEMLIDVSDDGPDGTDTLLPVYATYGGPGTAAGEIAVLQARGEATDIHGAWKQRYMFSIADLGTCSALNPEGTNTKNAKPAFVTWDTTQTCEDMLIMPIQFNQRTLEWVPYHNDNWYLQSRTYSKKCSGCHEAGLTLTADIDGNVTQYEAVDYRIGCEKCHGPGGSHVANGGDPNYIMNPNHMTVTAATEVCGQCHSRGADPVEGFFGFPWRSDVAEFDGNFVAGLHTLDWDAVEAPEGYFLQKPGNWPTGFPKSHRQQYNSYLMSSHIDNPFHNVTCNDCHSPHSGRGGPFQFENADADGNDFLFADNSRTLMSNVVCLSCHATHGPFASVTLDDVAIYHTTRGGTVEKNGAALAPTAAEQTAASDIIEQAVKAHNGTVAGMPLAPYVPEGSHIPAKYQLGEGPVGRCTACHMTKTAKSGTWFEDADGRIIEGDNSNHSFEIVDIQPGTVQPNTCGSCHESFRTTDEPPGGD